MERFYVNGNRLEIINYEHGTSEEYSYDGVLQMRINYVNGIIHGLLERFDGMGNRYSVINYVNGVANGIMEKFDTKGRIIETSEFIHSEITKFGFDRELVKTTL